MTEQGHTHLTLEQMESWWKAQDQAALRAALEKANECAPCNRIWMKFWASVPK